jgi:hypothetical protein
MIMSATAASASPERVPKHQSLIDTPAPLSKGRMNGIYGK